MRSTIYVKILEQNTRLFKGLDLGPNYISLAWDAAEKQCAENPDLRIIPDMESMFPQVVTKEQHEAYLKMWEDLKPKELSKEIGGKIITFGTGGEMEGKANFSEYF